MKLQAPAIAACALALLLTTTGILHFTAASAFESIVPRWAGSAAFWVVLSGVGELICALGLAFRRTRRLAGWACVVGFIAVYPANITMAVHALHGHGSVLISLLRLPLQIPLLMWAWYIARHTDDRAPSWAINKGNGRF